MYYRFKAGAAFFSVFLFTFNIHAQRVKRYDLYVTDTMVNYSGKHKMAIAVNSQTPMPTLKFTEGDTAEIVVHNR
ncbi:multicopper oxidase domain-containing protein [Niabella sp. CC-SYL272]|uniref:multicopper oxidase domain-containing protein n=1 Tax=Niabella agricola TaxID=2891571 RepID=UPI001F317AD7|nr:multicopper oxidase domain-containing protein [Niabella agricola]MCF3111977.1 multicopper oxidase domain-containing protein [Niabella agricola]